MWSDLWFRYGNCITLFIWSRATNQPLAASVGALEAILWFLSATGTVGPLHVIHLLRRSRSLSDCGCASSISTLGDVAGASVVIRLCFWGIPCYRPIFWVLGFLLECPTTGATAYSSTFYSQRPHFWRRRSQRVLVLNKSITDVPLTFTGPIRPRCWRLACCSCAVGTWIQFLPPTFLCHYWVYWL